MTSTSTLAIALTVAAALSACATAPRTGTEKKPAASVTVTGPIALTGSNGDMNRYLGTWTSACGKDFTGAGGALAQSSGTNSFEFTSVSGRSVRGRLMVETYPTTNCTGSPTRSTADVALNFAGVIAVADLQGRTGEFSGTADKLSATVAGGNNGNSTSVFNVGFFDNFSKFKLSPFDYFSAADLTYAKQPAP